MTPVRISAGICSGFFATDHSTQPSAHVYQALLQESAQLRAAEVLDGDVVRKVLPPIVRYKVDVKITEAERARLLTILSDIRRDQTIAPAAVITKMNPVQRVTNAVAMTYTLNNIRAHLDAPQGA